MDIKIKNTMPKVCAAIAITNMEELKNHGIVHMKNYMQMECAKIAILIHITEKGEKRGMKKPKKLNVKVS